jgi:Malate/L-lactate dehydrogenase
MFETLSFKAADVRCFAESVFVACGAPPDEAALIAEHLIKANLMGYDSHGIIRIPQYVNDVKQGVVVPGAPVTPKNQTDTTALVDCGWNFGQVGAFRALQCAIDKARAHNVGMIVTQRCNHAGSVLTRKPPPNRVLLLWGSATLHLEMAILLHPGEGARGVFPPIRCPLRFPAETVLLSSVIFPPHKLLRENSGSTEIRRSCCHMDGLWTRKASPAMIRPISMVRREAQSCHLAASWAIAVLRWGFSLNL